MSYDIADAKLRIIAAERELKAAREALNKVENSLAAELYKLDVWTAFQLVDNSNITQSPTMFKHTNDSYLIGTQKYSHQEVVEYYDNYFSKYNLRIGKIWSRND